MPIKLPDGFPAKKQLVREGIDAMDYSRAETQDIRPLRILIANLMPKKIDTEVQLLRLIGNNPIQIEAYFLRMSTHDAKNIPNEHLNHFYVQLSDIAEQKFDALIVTGAPVEQLDFKDVDYWNELQEVFEWSRSNVFSTLFICWGAQAGLFYFYGIDKIPLAQKLFGIFEQRISRRCFLFRGFDDTYYCPQSRWTGIDETKLKNAGLHVISRGMSPKIDNYANLIEDKNHRRVFILGHLEYERWTLDAEYKRDSEQGIDIQVPYNYYPHDDPSKEPKISWRAHANLFFNNWVNFVYQETKFDLDKLEKLED